jgi:hypothetical protein
MTEIKNVNVMKESDESKGDGGGFEGWWEERSLPEKIVAGIGFAILGIGLLAGLGLVVMLLWNWLMPEIFGLKQLNYWQAWGLLILSWILFKGLGSSAGSSGSTERKRKRELRRHMREGESLAGEDSTVSRAT